jgi:hypothetical protein
MSTTRNRIKNNAFYEAYRIFIKEHYKNENPFDRILKETIIFEKMGNESKYGEIYKGKISCIKNNNLISIKKIALSLIDLEIFLKNQHYNKNIIFSEKTIWREMYLLKLCTKLLKHKKTVHLPLHYFFVYSSNNDWNKDISKNSPHIYSFNELANEDLKSWSKINHTIEEWKSCFLQIFFSIYCLQYYSGFLHNDLHWGNVLVFNIPKGGYWTYKINNNEYYIQNEGYLFTIWDFGMSSLSPNLKYCRAYEKSCQDFIKILNTPKWIKKYYESIQVPKIIIDFCIHTRSIEYQSMDDLLNRVISKWSYKTIDNEIESFHIS